MISVEKLIMNINKLIINFPNMIILFVSLCDEDFIIKIIISFLNDIIIANDIKICSRK